MKASERVQMIKACAGHLEPEDWPIIDLTLEQFGLPTTEVWSGTKEAYLIEMIKVAKDETLVDLAQHVGVEFGLPKPGINPPFWRDGMLRVFISHLAEHRAFTAEVQSELLRYGITGFVAHNDIEPTTEWMTQIETALATCDALVALLHPGFHQSKWTDQEVGFVMGRGLPVFTVRFGEDPYGFMGRFQAFNGNGKSVEAISRELFEAYRTNKETAPQFAEVLMRIFEQSGSFADAKAKIGYLEELKTWAPSFAPRLKAAVEGNSQIRDSWGVPERIDALITKWS